LDDLGGPLHDPDEHSPAAPGTLESHYAPRATLRLMSSQEMRDALQVLPATIEDLGFDPERIEDPETGIHAGVRYLAWLRDRFDEDLPVRDRMSFTLAAPVSMRAARARPLAASRVHTLPFRP